MSESDPSAETKFLLEVENLTVEHRTPLGEIVLAPREIDFFLKRGEILALVGERGSGKSAIGQALSGVMPPGSKKLSGDILFDGENVAQLSRSQLREFRRKKIAFLLRDPHDQLNPFITIRQHLRETIRLADRENEFANDEDWTPVFYDVGIVDPERFFDRHSDELSTEDALRIMLATALFSGAELLVCDQATTTVDPAVAMQILDMLRNFRTERDLGILLATDHLLSVEKIADRVIVLFEGGIAEMGEPDRVIQKPRTAYTRTLIDAIPQIHEKRTRLSEPDDETIREARVAIHKKSAI